MGAGKTTAARTSLGGSDGRSTTSSRRRRRARRSPELFREQGRRPSARSRSRRSCSALARRRGDRSAAAPSRRARATTRRRRLARRRRRHGWERVKGTDRPLAQDEAAFRALYEERRAALRRGRRRASRATATTSSSPLPASTSSAARCSGSASSSPATAPVALVSDPHVAGIHGMDAQLALGARLAETHELPPGEEAKTLAALDRLWQELRLDRSGTIVALGGGCTTDAAGFAAAAYLRGVAWVPGADEPRRPGRRGDRRQDGDRPAAGQEPRRRLPLAGADGDRPGAARDAARAAAARGHGRGREDRAARRRAALGAAGRRARPPLRRLQGRASASATRTSAASGRCSTSATRSPTRSRPPPATRASRTGAPSRSASSPRSASPAARRRVVEEVLRPQPVRVDRERAWQAMQRDKKARGGELRLVLLGDDGPRLGRRGSRGGRAPRTR